jgi:2-amino-4-hydroxy-6-hydroxymethyldihydropteridine diphosphokinase
MAGPDGLSPALAYIGLGSNLADPRAQVLSALEDLARLPGCALRQRSGLYATRPVGPIDQPEFVNAVAAITTTLTPPQLLAALQGIEQAHGRARDGTRWGPRTLDLDLLVYGETRMQTPALQLPHPEIARRAFVLVPLAELAPAGLLIPGQGYLGELLAALADRDGVRPIPDPPNPEHPD